MTFAVELVRRSFDSLRSLRMTPLFRQLCLLKPITWIGIWRTRNYWKWYCSYVPSSMFKWCSNSKFAIKFKHKTISFVKFKFVALYHKMLHFSMKSRKARWNPHSVRMKSASQMKLNPSYSRRSRILSRSDFIPPRWDLSRPQGRI